MKEVIRKLGYKTANGSNSKTVIKRINDYNISTEHFKYKPGTDRTKENIFCINSTASQSTLRRWYKQICGSECEICSICGQDDLWNDQKLIMILDHKNGDNHDNRFENLRWVCPNCNTQLPTFTDKNNKKRKGYMPVNDRKSKKKICPVCNINEISLTAKQCMECRSIERRKNIPSKEELEELIYKESFVSIGNKYGVSDNAVRKWCQSYGLPYRYGELHKLLA